MSDPHSSDLHKPTAAGDSCVAAKRSDPGHQQSFWRCIGGHFATGVVVTLFLALGYIAFRQFLGRQWVAAYFAACGALMCMPLVGQSSPLRERLLASFVMAFAISGLAGFVLLYIQMFRFEWFEALFNDKGAGPFGLLISATIGLGAGGFVGYQLIKQVGQLLESADRMQTSREPPSAS